MSEIETILQESQICLNLASTSKEDVIHELVQLMSAGGGIIDPDSIEAGILEREREISTGLHDGIAIPHCKSDSVERIRMAVGLKPDGLEFEAMDGSPSTIFVAIASPTSATSEHIKIMSEVGRVLRDPSIRKALLKAESTREVLTILSDGVVEA